MNCLSLHFSLVEAFDVTGDTVNADRASRVAA